VKLPDYLIIHLRRFEESEKGLKKNKNPIEYPLEIDMSRFCSKSWANQGKFQLIGLIIHKGNSLGEGHYVALSRRNDGKWYYCNDAQVTEIEEELVTRSQRLAYLLLYRRQH